MSDINPAEVATIILGRGTGNKMGVGRQGWLRRWVGRVDRGPRLQLAGKRDVGSWTREHMEDHSEDITSGIVLLSTVESRKAPQIRGVKWPPREEHPTPSLDFKQAVCLSYCEL